MQRDQGGDDQWTPLDDIGRTQASILHNLQQLGPAIERVREAREQAAASMDRFIAALSAGAVDWSAATEDEAREMAEALDTIHRVRDLLAGDEGGDGS